MFMESVAECSWKTHDSNNNSGFVDQTGIHLAKIALEEQHDRGAEMLAGPEPI